MELASRGAFGGRANDFDVSVLAPKEKKKLPKPVQFRPPADLVEEIDQVRTELGLSRNEAMTQLLRFALEAHRKEQKKAKK